jgi:hypothetical protein
MQTQTVQAMRRFLTGVAALLLVTATSTGAQAAAPTAAIAQALTTNHLFRVVVLAAPQPVPLQQHFAIELAVYRAKPPRERIKDAQLVVTAGMTHGTGNEFMHGMLSTPVVQKQKGRYMVRGLMFHMEGPWIIRVQVREDGRNGTADLTLDCCGED